VKQRRKSARYDQVLADLRREIVSGRYAHGERLPTHRELSEAMGVSSVTVFKALGQLASEGFVESQGRRGTFVCHNAPHLTDYAMAFHMPADADVWSYSPYFRALVAEADRLSRSSERNVRVYYGIYHNATGPEVDRLRADVEAHRLAGVIVGTPPAAAAVAAAAAAGGGLRQSDGLVRVGIGMNAPACAGRMIMSEGDSWAPWIAQALRWLADRRRSRVAVICSEAQAASHVELFQKVIQDAGMQTRPSWIQSTSPSRAPWCRNLVHLLMERSDDRPDALLITDDVLVPAATAGLLDARIRMPDDLDVVAHANFPLPPMSVTPMRRLGFDIRLLVTRAIGLIDHLRADPKAAAKGVAEQSIPLQWEEEVAFNRYEIAKPAPASAPRRAVRA
jgi:DNA-binding transcriptional regulator YhcF (GntR family)